jgi:formylglycine-generating enzyme required for sulfatase activity
MSGTRARTLLGALFAALAVFAIASDAVAQKREPRIALVIANGAYASFDKLTATYSDGDTIAAALSGVGFVDSSGSGPVKAHRDLTQAQLLAEVAGFKAQLAKAGPQATGMLYFSGHGAALGSFGDVIMLPIDAGKTGSLEQEALSRSTVTKNLLGSGAKTVLIVLDMCRNVIAEPARAAADPTPANNIIPVAADGTPTRGLKRISRQEDNIRPDQGFLVAFSTSPDQVAFDDGAFSKVLAEEIRRPQQDVAAALKRVSDRVAMQPGRSRPQKPTFDYGLQGQPPCFVSCDPSAGTDRFYDCANCPWMRVVPSGEAVLGSPAGEVGRGRDEPVAHPVKIDKPFALGVYEVTIAEWAACVRDGACKALPNWAKENPNPLLPASHMSLFDAEAFVGWISTQSGKTYRLPTDAEWEYADRAGAGSAFPFGDDITPSQANYDHTAKYKGSPTAPYRGYPEVINAFPPNGFGFYQMQGNMWEWTDGCADTACRNHVVRGGSFQSAPVELRAANRFALASDKRREDVGLRVARDLRPDEVSQ